MSYNLDVLKHLNILCVEDDIEMQKYMKRVFEMFFKKVYMVSKIEDALNFMNSKIIHIVFTDIELPDGNGIEFAKEIREKNYSIPIVILTNFMNTEFLHLAIPLNITNYIKKPMSYETLKETLKDCIKRLDNKCFSFPLTSNTTYSYIDKTIKTDDKITFLGINEYTLLELFISNVNKIVTRRDIEIVIYERKEMSDSAYKNLMLRFRKKFPFLEIITIKNTGYMLKLGSYD